MKEKVVQMSASAALFTGPELRGLCHGEEFLLIAARRELEVVEAHLSSTFEMRRRGTSATAKDARRKSAQSGSWGD